MDGELTDSLDEIIQILLALKEAISRVNKVALSLDDWRKLQVVISMLDEVGTYFGW